MEPQHRVGQQFGNYRLTRLLGQGGYAEVYLAENVLINNLQYAIKLLTETNLTKQQREEFFNEARTVANLQRLSSYIVQIHDFGIQLSEDTGEGGIPYLVMEYAPEGTVRTHYPRGSKMPLKLIVLYAKQIAEALQCAHDQEPAVIHCDVKPENMLLRKRDHLLLSDFGIAIIGKTSTQQRVPTRDLSIIGTATYIAPERLATRTTGKASDQYSLGVVVYEWLCGVPPFEGLDLEICYKHMTEPPPPLLSGKNPHITSEIEGVVFRALKKQPAERYVNVTDFANALEHAVQKAQKRNPVVQQGSLPVLRRQQDSKPYDEKTQVAPLLSSQPRSRFSTSETQKLPVPSASQKSFAQSIDGGIQQPAPQRIISPYEEDTFADKIVIPGGQSQGTAKPPDFLAQLEPFVNRPESMRVRRRTRDFFALSPSFIQDSHTIFFIYSGILCNVLSALALGFFKLNFVFLFVGLFFSLIAFVLSILFVEKVFATFFALLVTGYWFVVGWSMGSFFVVHLHVNPVLAPVFTGIVFGGISLMLNLWYVAKKFS